MPYLRHNPVYYPPTHLFQMSHISLVCTVCDREIWVRCLNRTIPTKYLPSGKILAANPPSTNVCPRFAMAPGGAYKQLAKPDICTP